MKGIEYMLRILGAPRRVRVAVAGTFVLSAILLSTGVASMAAAAATGQVPQQVQYTAQPGYGQDGDQEKSKSPSPIRTPTKSATPSKSPSKSPSMSPTPSKSTSPSASASQTTAAPTVAPTSLPVTGSSTGPVALVGGGLLLSGLTLLGVWRFVARRT
jgi:cytoskeletal protein RodZ